MIRSPLFMTLSALAMVIGGVFWMVKAIVIMVAGFQPPLLFEVAPTFFAVGLFGLYALLGEWADRLAQAGALTAALSLVAKGSTGIYEAMPGAELPVGDQFLFPYSLFVLVGNAGGLVGLLLLGISILRSQTMPHPWRLIPLGVALSPIPAILAAVLHFEAPIVLIGGAWVLLGYWLWRSSHFIQGRPLTIK